MLQDGHQHLAATLRTCTHVDLYRVLLMSLLFRTGVSWNSETTIAADTVLWACAQAVVPVTSTHPDTVQLVFEACGVHIYLLLATEGVFANSLIFMFVHTLARPQAASTSL